MFGNASLIKNGEADQFLISKQFIARFHLDVENQQKESRYHSTNSRYIALRYGLAYQKRSEEEFIDEHHKRQEKNLHRRAKELGYDFVKRQPEPTPTPA